MGCGIDISVNVLVQYPKDIFLKCISYQKKCLYLIKIKTMRKTETGLYILYYNNKVEVYTQQEYNIMYNHNSWWSYVKNKFFQ